MDLSTVITVEVTQLPPSLSAQGFGRMLGLVYNPAFTARTKSYFSAAEGATDYPNTQSAERRFLDAAFSQTPHPTEVKLGRGALKPTLRYKISALTPASFPTTLYTVGVKFGSTSTSVSFTTDASPTDAEFATALVTALNGVAGKNFTASGSASPVTVTADTPGAFFALEVKNRQLMSITMDHADPGIATDLAAILAEDPFFDLVIPTQASDAMIAAAGVWALANTRLFMFDTCDSAAVTTVKGSASDPIDVIQTIGNRLASGWFHTDPAMMLAAAVAGKVLPTDAGSETWAFKTLDGVNPVTMSEAEFQHLKDKDGNTYVAFGANDAVKVTWDGSTASGSYLDLQRGLLWFISLVQTDVFNFFTAASASGKIGFDAEGRAALQAIYRSSCKKGVKRKFIAPDEFTVTMLALADVPAADRQNRHYPDTTIEFRALGAMHSADVKLVMKV